MRLHPMYECGESSAASFGIVHFLGANLAADEVGRDVVRLAVDQEVGEDPVEAEAAVLPASLHLAPTLRDGLISSAVAGFTAHMEPVGVVLARFRCSP